MAAVSCIFVAAAIILPFAYGSVYFIAYHHSDPTGHHKWMIGSRQHSMNDKEWIQMEYLYDRFHIFEESHSCYRAMYKQIEVDFCYPSVIVHAVGKCGTSAAYQIISDHPQVLGGLTKENCGHYNRTTRELFSFFQDLSWQSRLAHKRNISTLLSGCIRQSFNENMIKVLKTPKTVYVVMTRDMADYMWAGYNYWCTPRLDSHCTHAGHRTIEGLHERTPEHFDALLSAKAAGKQSPTHWIIDKMDRIDSFFSDYYVGSLLRAGARENAVVVFSSEQMSRNASLFWRRLTSTPLLKSRPGLSEHPSVTSEKYNSRWRVNTGNNKGSTAQSVLVDTLPLGSYRISGYRPMLNTSRRLIDGLWRYDCLWVANATEYKYAACAK